MSSEFSIIKQYFTRNPQAPLFHQNDDDAVILPTPIKGNSLVMTSDMLCEDVHFFAKTDPYRLGWKSLAVNISDLAAMGAIPKYAQLAIALPNLDHPWLAKFSSGFWDCADRYQIQLTGGDTTKGKLTIAITALGEVTDRALLRSNAKNNDDIWLSGNPGYAAIGLKIRQGLLKVNESQLFIDALEMPTPRVELGLCLHQLLMSELCHAAIDISDGVLADLQHIAELSNLNAEIFLENFPSLPTELMGILSNEQWQILQTSGGDDYELCFTAKYEARASILNIAKQLNLPLFRIGKMKLRQQNEKDYLEIYNINQQKVNFSRFGFEHFVSN